MRARIVALLSVLLVSVGLWGQAKQVSTVTESGDIRNVIAFSGTVSASERFVANERESTYEKTLKGRNISGKPILLVIVGLDCCATQHVFVTDNFLGEAIKPDEEITFTDAEPSRQVSAGNPLGRPSAPEASARVVYVQFADGTTLGDESAAKGALAQRAAVVKSLRELAAAYAERGEEAFKKALAGTFPEEVSWYLQVYRKTTEAKGAQTAVAMINKRLQCADANASLMSAQ